MKQTIPICLLILIIAISYMIYKKREQFTTTTQPFLMDIIIHMKNLSDCMLENGTGWGGLGTGGELENKRYLNNKELFDKITNIKNAKNLNLSENITTVRAKGDPICDQYRTKIGGSYDKLFKLLQPVPSAPNPDDYNPLSGLILLYWLQQEGYIKFTLMDKTKYNTFFVQYDEYEAITINKDLKEFIHQLLRVKKNIIQHLNTTASEQDRELQENVDNLYLILDNFQLETYGFVVVHALLVYDILSDPLEKCKCMNIG